MPKGRGFTVCFDNIQDDSNDLPTSNDRICPYGTCGNSHQLTLDGASRERLLKIGVKQRVD